MKTILYQPKNKKSHLETGRHLWDLPECPEGYVIVIKKNKPIRSLSANKYYHAILNIIAIETGHTHEQLHDICKKKFNAEVIFFPKSGTEIRGKSTSNLDTAEFAGYVNRVKQWAIDEFDIVIPEAKDIDYQKWLDIEMKYGKTFSGF